MLAGKINKGQPRILEPATDSSDRLFVGSNDQLQGHVAYRRVSSCRSDTPTVEKKLGVRPKPRPIPNLRRIDVLVALADVIRLTQCGRTINAERVKQKK